jgi:hypothetical protein
MASTVLAWPRSPLPAPPAGISLAAFAFQLGSAAFALPGTEQSQFWPPPRLLSVSLRSKQYDHWLSAVASPAGT